VADPARDSAQKTSASRRTWQISRRCDGTSVSTQRRCWVTRGAPSSRLEYAVRHPERVSHSILMNPAPISRADYLKFRNLRLAALGADLDRQKAAAATEAFREGDPDAVAAYYRIHFKQALRRPEDLETVIARLRASLTREGVLKARAVEDRLMQDTWSFAGYDLIPKLRTLRIPTWSSPRITIS
jgi:proline iminopeptidase